MAKAKNPAAVALGRKGGKARARKLKEELTAAERSEQMRALVQKRWGKKKKS